MSSLTPKDRVSLCSFTFSDGRRCRTPRTRNNPRFCSYHAEKEARARAAQKLGKDLDYFFSGDYLSACDLSTALGRLLPAVVRGDVKPRAARTVAYLAQTLLQTIHLSKHEYINAFGTDDWREAVRNSVNSNHDYLFPPDPEQPADQAPDVVAGLQAGAGQAPQPAPPTQPAPQPAPSPHTPLPPTRAQFVQHVLAGLQTGDFQASSEHRIHSARSGRSEPVPIGNPDSVGSAEAFRSASPPNATPSSPSAPTAATGTTSPPRSTPSSPIFHPERSATFAFPTGLRNEGSCLDPAIPTADETHSIPATPFARSNAPAAPPDKPPATASSTPRPTPARDPHAVYFDHNYRLLIDGKPF